MVVSFCAKVGSDQSAAASVGWVVPVSDNVLEALVLHFLSGMRRTEKEKDGMLEDRAGKIQIGARGCSNVPQRIIYQIGVL